MFSGISTSSKFLSLHVLMFVSKLIWIQIQSFCFPALSGLFSAYICTIHLLSRGLIPLDTDQQKLGIVEDDPKSKEQQPSKSRERSKWKTLGT